MPPINLFNVVNQTDDSAEIYVMDQITNSNWYGVSPDMIRSQLSAFKGKKALTIHVNSPGGSVYAGSAIYSMLKSFPAQKTVVVHGMAASMGSIIAMAGDVIKMAHTAQIMIHNPTNGVMGEAKDFRAAAEQLDEVKQSLMNAYEAKTKLSREEISKMMDATTWMGAARAKELGFIDEILHNAPDAAPADTIKNFFPAPAQPTGALPENKPLPNKPNSNNSMKYPLLLALLGLTEGATDESAKAAVEKLLADAKTAGAADVVKALRGAKADALPENLTDAFDALVDVSPLKALKMLQPSVMDSGAGAKPKTILVDDVNAWINQNKTTTAAKTPGQPLNGMPKTAAEFLEMRKTAEGGAKLQAMRDANPEAFDAAMDRLV